MSSADLPGAIVACATWLRTRPRRYGFAVVLVAVATLARYALGLMFGPLPPFVVFLSAIILVALLAGFGPGTLATLLSAASVASFFWPSLGVFGSSRPREIVGSSFFAESEQASVAWADSTAFTSPVYWNLSGSWKASKK